MAIGADTNDERATWIIELCVRYWGKLPLQAEVDFCMAIKSSQAIHNGLFTNSQGADFRLRRGW